MNIKRLALVLVLVVFAVGGCMAKAQNNSYVADVQNFAVSGWTADDEEHIWTFVSADAPSFIISVNADVTGYMSAGLKFRVKQSGTDELFFITKVGSYTGGATELTLYGGTDYELDATGITEVAYSRVQSPYGFPLNPDKWTIEVVDSSFYSQSASNNTWYNVGSISIPIKVGSWYVGYYASVEVDNSPDYTAIISVSLSDNPASESTIKTKTTASVSTNVFVLVSDVFIETRMTLDANQTYYLILRGTSSNITYLKINGTTKSTILYAICAYL